MIMVLENGILYTSSFEFTLEMSSYKYFQIFPKYRDSYKYLIIDSDKKEFYLSDLKELNDFIVLKDFDELKDFLKNGKQ